MTRFRWVSVGIVRLHAFVLLAAGGSAATTAGVFAQQAEIARQVRQMSTAEIVQAVVASGLSRAEARVRLGQLGYDPYLADPYFDAIGRGTTLPRGEVEASALEAFRGIGLVVDIDTTASVIQRPPLADSLGDLASEGPRVFGRRVFRQSTSRFGPLLTGPVGDDYVLGPGDRITLIVTGNVELVREQMVVSREGFLVIPDVGQVAVVGLTVEELRERLFTRLRRVYSGIGRGPDANTFFSVSIAGLRTIQVRVLGEVVRPGSYQLSSVATVLEALYFAGGPTDHGTYRRVMLRRGREAPLEVDLYPYLTAGNLSEDHRLQSGDVVFVPEVGRQATIIGEVRRAAIFELAQGEELKDLLQFAGGLLPSASTHRAGVERILPSADRTPGVDRVMVDAPLAAVMEGTESFDVLPGDQISIYPVRADLRRRVEIRGAVWFPGHYELRSGTTVASLIERAGGGSPGALLDQVQLRRFISEEGNQQLVGTDSLQTVLQDQDIVTVYSRDQFSQIDSIFVYGGVQNPGGYPYLRGMLASDAVMEAGGFLKDANNRFVNVVRRLDHNRSAEVTTVMLADRFDDLGQLSDISARDGWVPETTIPLTPGSAVYVRRERTDDYGHVSIIGEVTVPGQYALLGRGDHFSSVLSRAGGINQYADTAGVQLVRERINVGIEYDKAVRYQRSEYDPILIDGDTIRIAARDETVFVNGAVNFPSRVMFVSGMGVEDILSEAGGPIESADLDRISVRYADGRRRTVTKALGLFRRYPTVRPGSQVFVPLQDEQSGTDWGTILNASLTATSTMTTLFLLIREISNN